MGDYVTKGIDIAGAEEGQCTFSQDSAKGRGISRCARVICWDGIPGRGGRAGRFCGAPRACGRVMPGFGSRMRST